MQRQNGIHLPSAGHGRRGNGLVGSGHALDAQTKRGVGCGGMSEQMFGYKGVEVVFWSFI